MAHAGVSVGEAIPRSESELEDEPPVLDLGDDEERYRQAAARRRPLASGAPMPYRAPAVDIVAAPGSDPRRRARRESAGAAVRPDRARRPPGTPVPSDRARRPPGAPVPSDRARRPARAPAAPTAPSRRSYDEGGRGRAFVDERGTDRTARREAGSPAEERVRPRRDRRDARAVDDWTVDRPRRDPARDGDLDGWTGEWTVPRRSRRPERESARADRSDGWTPRSRPRDRGRGERRAGAAGAPLAEAWERPTAEDWRRLAEDRARREAEREALAIVDRSAAPRETTERRTIIIRGRGSERSAPSPSARRRPQQRAYERPGFRPDRIGMWAVLLGVLLILVAATSSRAAVRARQPGVRPAPRALKTTAHTPAHAGPYAVRMSR